MSVPHMPVLVVGAPGSSGRLVVDADAAGRKTFELVAELGPAPMEPGDVEALFAPLEADPPGALAAARDASTMPLDDEPARFREDLRRLHRDRGG